MNRLVIVGESNPYGADPCFALYHLPRRASGDRLREHLGLTDETYEAIDKVNLCAGRWNMAEARERGWGLASRYDVLVLLGVKVAVALDMPGATFTARVRNGKFEDGTPRTWTLVSIPHPSGRNRTWDSDRVWRDLGARDIARALLREHAPWVPWGEAP